MQEKGELSKIKGKHLQHSNRNCKYMQHFTKTGNRLVAVKTES